MIELILHGIGDYFTQSHWMAENKTKSSVAAGLHALVYSLPFLLLKPSWAAMAVICITHFFIDRFRLVRRVIWLTNLLFDPRWWALRDEDSVEFDTAADSDARVAEKRAYARRFSWANCSATGYPADLPPFLAVTLMIVTDNFMHIFINYFALRHL